ncbi:hypothetical protein EDD86DRAFT_205191 [Gorgonomyces haynaldii]|nr:hypothetical protein EDD86DRAFT_205191 [Gorgonomyces haynaldii]
MDVTSKWNTMNIDFQKRLSAFVDAYTEYREKLKEIKKMSDSVHELANKHKHAQEKLNKAISANKPSEQLQREASQLEYEFQCKSAEYESVKRALLKDGLIKQAEGWSLLGKHMEILAVFQKHLANQIPQGTLAPGQELPMYTGAGTTQQIVNDFLQASGNLPQTPQDLTLSRSSFHSLESLSRQQSVQEQMDPRRRPQDTVVSPGVSPQMAPYRVSQTMPPVQLPASEMPYPQQHYSYTDTTPRVNPYKQAPPRQ